MFRITFTTPDGTTRLSAEEPGYALVLAREANAAARSDIWIGDDEGHLYSIREFERFMGGVS